MIDGKLLSEVLKQRISSHEKDADDFKEYEIKFDMEEMHLRLADECQAIIELVEEQPKVGEWIPVYERLPQENVPVLVCNNKGNVFVRQINWIGRGGTMTVYWSKYACNIVAWMPLPEPCQA